VVIEARNLWSTQKRAARNGLAHTLCAYRVCCLWTCISSPHLHSNAAFAWNSGKWVNWKVEGHLGVHMLQTLQVTTAAGATKNNTGRLA